VTVFLIAACSVLFGLYRWKKNEEQSKNSPLRLGLATELEDVALYATIGLLLVALIQIALGLAPWVLEPSLVLKWECDLVWLQDQMKWFLAWKIQVPLWILVLLISLLSSTSFVTRWASLRKPVTRMMIALNVISSFTFFSLKAVEYGEPQWVAKWTSRAEIRAHLAELNEARKRELLAGWIVNHAVGPQGDPGARNLLSMLAASNVKPETVARILASDVPDFGFEIAGRASATRIDRWATGASQERPTLAEAKSVVTQKEEAFSRATQTEKALTELVKAAVGEILPVKDDVIKSFLKAFTGEVIKSKMKGQVPKWFKTAGNWAGKTRSVAFPNSRRAAEGYGGGERCCLIVTTVNGATVDVRHECGAACLNAKPQ